jgi:hypothetical protein
VQVAPVLLLRIVQAAQRFVVFTSTSNVGCGVGADLLYFSYWFGREPVTLSRLRDFFVCRIVKWLREDKSSDRLRFLLRSYDEIRHRAVNRNVARSLRGVGPYPLFTEAESVLAPGPTDAQPSTQFPPSVVHGLPIARTKANCVYQLRIRFAVRPDENSTALNLRYFLLGTYDERS